MSIKIEKWLHNQIFMDRLRLFIDQFENTICSSVYAGSYWGRYSDSHEVPAMLMMLPSDFGPSDPVLPMTYPMASGSSLATYRSDTGPASHRLTSEFAICGRHVRPSTRRLTPH